MVSGANSLLMNRNPMCHCCFRINTIPVHEYFALLGGKEAHHHGVPFPLVFHVGDQHRGTSAAALWLQQWKQCNGKWSTLVCLLLVGDNCSLCVLSEFVTNAIMAMERQRDTNAGNASLLTAIGL